MFDSTLGPGPGLGVDGVPAFYYSIAAGGTQASWTVNLSNPAPSSGVTVSLQSSDTRWATVPATVTIPSGATKPASPFLVSKGSESFGGLATITATIGAGSRSNAIDSTDSLDFPQLEAPLFLLR